MKVLIIPSWYPNNNNEFVGSFFREQASLLSRSNLYDIRVLYSEIKSEGVFGFIKSLFPILLNRAPILETNYLLQQPRALSFTTRLNFRLNEKQKFTILFKNYALAYQALINNGWHPDVIHAQSSMDGGIFAMHLSHLFKVPYVIIEHQVFLLHHYSPFKQNLILRSLEKATKVGVVSEHQKKCVLMHQPNCDPIVIWNYVSSIAFKIRPQPQHNLFTIVTVTYPAPIKDCRTFFLAMKELHHLCGNDFRFIIVGNASFSDLSKANTDEFEAYSEELGINHLGTFVPYLSRSEISSVLHDSDVFVCTSIAETFGVAAREAMLCGLPVVSTACGGIEDSINETTGIVVPIRNPIAIANAILKIKNKEVMFSPQKIREYIIEQCGETTFVEKMDTFYTISQ